METNNKIEENLKENSKLTDKDRAFLKNFNVKGLSLKQKKFLCVYHLKMTNVSQSCKAVGITRDTFYRWKNDDKSDIFAKAVEDVQESMWDDAESILYKKVFKDEDTNVLLHLTRTKMKSRGYVETTETKHSGSITNNAVRSLTDEELEEEIRRLESDK